MAEKTFNLLIPATKAVDNGDGTWSIAVADLVGQDALYKVNTVSTTGFTWEADTSMTLAWVATNAGNP